MKRMNLPTCKLALADGLVFTGLGFGAQGTVGGEVVFNTSMTGYQEIITDPSYCGQIVTMTYPLVGNYGVTDEDAESRTQAPQVSGFIVREISARVSNFRAEESLGKFLRSAGVMALTEIDTRALVRHIRLDGAMNGILSTEINDDSELVDRARALPSMAGQDLVTGVKPDEMYQWKAGFESPFAQIASVACDSNKRRNIVAIDCGAKVNILRNLVQRGCDLTVVPAGTSADEILKLSPDGVFVSNGPGDPAAVTDVIEALKGLMGKVPMFGICLGHQMLALALGAETYKLKFGHRGGNQPVRNEATGKVEITSQNHGFAVDDKSLKQSGAIISHINLNDSTVEGFTHSDQPVFSVQYHPEAAPGPHDATYLFDCFFDMMDTGRAPSAEQMHAAQARLAGKAV